MFFADDLTLFAEASVAQMRVVMNCVDIFCKASGQRVNFQKSKIYVSANVSRDMCNSLENLSGVDVTRNLGNYLGVPILQSIVSKDTFGFLLDRINSKLNGWRKKTLSFAGRITLTKFVLLSLPIYTMSSLVLPRNVIGEMERLCRNFILGHKADSRPMHSLPWYVFAQEAWWYGYT